MSDERGIEIHQTVHGYRDGHELIGASLQLSGASRRTMLGLSDLSGDGPARGFEEYLTGYPLEEAGLYVFARTWYASEMPRPGCVWTHSLLLKMEDLEALVDPGVLRTYFSRPELARLSATLPSITYVEAGAPVATGNIDGTAYEIVTRLFADDAPVLVFGERQSRYEGTCLQLWAQQWSPLRRTFAFCTGSLELRSIEKRPFDLQVVPLQRQRRVLRASDRYSVISEDDVARANAPVAVPNMVSEPTAEEQQPFGALFAVSADPAFYLRELGEADYWHELIVRDLVHRNEPMREFLRAYTSDVAGKRVAHRNVIECWALLERLDAVGTSLHDVTAALTRGFPSLKEARKLKRAILGSDSLIQGREWEIVHELLTLPSLSALDPADLDLYARARQLFRSGRRWRADRIAWLLKSDQLNEVGRAVASSVIDNLSADDLANLFYEDRELFREILLRNPSLAAQRSLWQQPRELQRAIIRVVHDRPPGQSLQAIMFSVVKAGAASLLPELVGELGAGIVPQILDGIDDMRRSGGSLDDWEWAGQLRRYDEEILVWLAHCQAPIPWTLSFAVGLVGPYSKLLISTPSETFDRHLRDRSECEDDVAFVDYAAYCLAISLRNFNGDAGTVAAHAFHPVHSSVIRSRLSRRAWQWLGPQLPRLGYLSLESWDDGEKLRRALVDAFLRYGWDAALLAESIPDEQARQWIERYCQRFDDGRKLLRDAGFLPR